MGEQIEKPGQRSFQSSPRQIRQPAIVRRLSAIARYGAYAATAAHWRTRFLRAWHAIHLVSIEYLQMLTHVTYFIQPASALPTRRVSPTPGEVHPESSEKPRARIIANPVSGTMRAPGMLAQLQAAADYLTLHGLPAEVRLTEHVGHATELARESVAKQMDIVIAAGGDGTVNDVVQGLAGHPTALGVLPLGTVNVWARETGIPLHIFEACDVVLSGVRRRVDLGRANTRYFLMMAGIGFDAEVTRRVEHGRLKRLGLKLVEYLATASVLTLTTRPAHIWLTSNGKRRPTSALMIVIGNTRLYAGALTFATRAVADDGVLDIVVIGGGGLLYRAGVVRRALLRRPSRGPQLRYERARTIRIDSTPPMPVQVDGEIIGTLPMTFSIAPLALTVIVPQTAPAALFTLPSEPLQRTETAPAAQPSLPPKE